MKLAISNIAWADKDEERVAALLQTLGVRYVEIAPGKMRGLSAGEYVAFWERFGIKVVALQSLLFGKPDLKLFGTEQERVALRNQLYEMINLGRVLGAKVLVFGSPKNRQRGELPYEEALRIAQHFFQDVGAYADAAGVIIGLEPNPSQYGCDFVRTIAEAKELVALVASPGFQLHLDTGEMQLSEETLNSELFPAPQEIVHFHISDPNLEPIDLNGHVHSQSAELLRASGYQGVISIEMRSLDDGDALRRIETTITEAQRVYGV